MQPISLYFNTLYISCIFAHLKEIAFCDSCAGHLVIPVIFRLRGFLFV